MSLELLKYLKVLTEQQLHVVRSKNRMALLILKIVYAYMYVPKVWNASIFIMQMDFFLK